MIDPMFSATISQPSDERELLPVHPPFIIPKATLDQTTVGRVLGEFSVTGKFSVCVKHSAENQKNVPS